MSKKVTILNYSPRSSGNCGNICDVISEFYMRTNVQLFNITLDTVPGCRNCNYECLTPGEVCPNLTESYSGIMDAICGSDLVYYVIPNFCGYPCANYFAFNERSVGYFNMNRDIMSTYMDVKKRFIIVSNSEGQTFEDAMKQQTYADPEILYLKTRKYGKQSTDGDLMESDAARSDLLDFLSVTR